MVTETQLIQKGRFVKSDDGRWRCAPDYQPCPSAEGLALEDPNHAECLLCSNWNPKVGCVLGHNHALDVERCDLKPVDVANGQAKAWIEIRRLNRAIDRLDRFLRDYPDDADAYLALARLYDQPIYQGADKRRAIELYQRFVELRGVERKDDPDVVDAERRIPTLLRLPLPAPRRPEDEGGPVLAAFTCFYRFGSLTHLAYGVLTPSRMVLARVGDVDPESGRSAMEMGVQAKGSTRFLRWLAGEAARERETQHTRCELERVSLLSPAVLARESRTNRVIDCEHIRAVGLERERSRKASLLTVCSDHLQHELVFPDIRHDQAEHCAALLKHLAGRRGPSAGDHESTPRGAAAVVSE